MKNNTLPDWLLGIAFIVLKLTSIIDWSWWLILMPFWIGFVLTVVFRTIIGVIKHYIKEQEIEEILKEQLEKNTKAVKLSFQERIDKMKDIQKNK
jgi:hypothetical protein